MLETASGSDGSHRQRPHLFLARLEAWRAGGRASDLSNKGTGLTDKRAMSPSHGKLWSKGVFLGCSLSQKKWSSVAV